MRRGGGELPNNDTAPTGSWNATQSQSKSVVETWKVACKQAPKLINRRFTVFSHGIKYVVFTFGSVDKSIQMKPLGVLSHGTTYLARSSYCWSVDKIILVWPFKWNLFTQYVVLFSAGVCGILWSDHSNETSSAVLSHGPISIGNNYQKSIFSKTICYSPHGRVHGMAATFFFGGAWAGVSFAGGLSANKSPSSSSSPSSPNKSTFLDDGFLAVVASVGWRHK